ncbi:proline-rich receptor-like protein kinase PERK9 [Gallus gallus]|uniref:proline-rich receptor-like protein kinase PERK9 n=1 Tax=Gallus gallus TaxID=9031 RepID=UPI001AEB0A5D|nr:proline-rich receptor-like protein kinase PERK9 [Gallus gallus]
MKINCHVFQPLKQGLFLGEAVVDSLSLHSREGAGKERAVQHTERVCSKMSSCTSVDARGVWGTELPWGAGAKEQFGLSFPRAAPPSSAQRPEMLLQDTSPGWQGLGHTKPIRLAQSPLFFTVPQPRLHRYRLRSVFAAQFPAKHRSQRPALTAALASHPIAVTWEKRPTPDPPQPPSRQPERATRPPLSLPFSRPDNPSSSAAPTRPVLQTLPFRCPSEHTPQRFHVLPARSRKAPLTSRPVLHDHLSSTYRQYRATAAD